MVDVLEISGIVAAAGVLVGVIYYIFDMRNQSRVRQTDLLLRIYSTFGSEEFQRAFTITWNMQFKDYDEFVKKYSSPAGVADTREGIALGQVNVLFEEIGVLLHRKLVDISLVDDLFGYAALYVWEKIRPAVEGWRVQFQIPRSLQQFEYLYNELKKREQQLQSKR